MSRRLIAAVFVALLAFAQHAALAHGIWHAREAAHTGHPDHAPAKLAGCDFDAVYAEVLGTPGTSVIPAVPEYTGHHAGPLCVFESLVSASAPTPRSTGPPAFS